MLWVVTGFPLPDQVEDRLRGNDRELDRIVIPAKAGIQELLPGLVEKLR